MIQKLIKIGSSTGVIIPKSELKKLNVVAGDQVEIAVQKADEPSAEDLETIKTAKHILTRYRSDFESLADR